MVVLDRMKTIVFACAFQCFWYRGQNAPKCSAALWLKYAVFYNAFYTLLISKLDIHFCLNDKSMCFHVFFNTFWYRGNMPGSAPRLRGSNMLFFKMHLILFLFGR